MGVPLRRILIFGTGQQLRDGIRTQSFNDLASGGRRELEIFRSRKGRSGKELFVCLSELISAPNTPGGITVGAAAVRLRINAEKLTKSKRTVYLLNTT